MASCSFTALGLFLLVLCNGCLAIRQGRQEEQEPYRQSQGDCRLQKLRTLEPDSQIQHEAGVTQIWNPNSDEMQCAGITASRHVIDRRAALLPSFTNAPMVVYVEQGRGLLGTVFPGCPETYQSFQRQSQEGSKSRRSDDRHQKLRRLQQGDVFVLTVGVAHWVFNDGNNKLVLFAIHDVSNRENQLDDNLRRFLLAGSPPEKRGGKQQLPNITNIFQYFDTRILADAFSVPISIARKLKEVDESKGFIVRVQKAFQVIKPQEEDDDEEQRGSGRNGIEETICSMKLVENIDDPERADIYTAEGGRIATLNSRNLPILKRVKLSAGRVVLHKNGMVVPHWNMDAHSIMFVTKGSGKVQVIGMSRRPIFDGEVRKGQILIVPQNHALTKIAGDEGLEWFTVKTNDQASITPLAGPTSAIRALPVDLLMSSYGLTNQEARKLKEETKEVTIVVRRRSSSGRKEEGSREESRRPEEEEEEEEEESEGSSRGQKEEGREGSSRRKEDKGSEAAVEAVKAIVEAMM